MLVGVVARAGETSLTSKVKRRRARSALGWGTACGYPPASNFSLSPARWTENRPARSQQPNVYLEPKWLRCWIRSLRWLARRSAAKASGTKASGTKASGRRGRYASVGAKPYLQKASREDLSGHASRDPATTLVLSDRKSWEPTLCLLIFLIIT